MSKDSEYLIQLDDRPSLITWLAVLGIVVLLVGGTVFVGGQVLDPADSEADVTTMVTVTPDVCAQWTVPEFLQPAVEFAYPSWRWVCRLVNDNG